MPDQSPCNPPEPQTTAPIAPAKREYSPPALERLGTLLHSTAGTAGAPGDATGNPASVTGG